MIVKVKPLYELRAAIGPKWQENEYSEILSYFAQYFTVEHVRPDGRYILRGNDFIWNPEWFEGLEPAFDPSKWLESKQILEIAQDELRKEEHHKAIQKMKERLKSKKWWHRFFPWVISISRRW